MILLNIFGDLIRAGIDAEGPGGTTRFLNPVQFAAGVQPLVGTGKIFYVDSGSGSNTNTGTSVTQALATIDAAVGKCEASRGDVIYVMQGHAENISAATSLVCDIAGITIIGLGVGTLRPTLTFTAAAGSIVVSAANVTFQNFLMIANYADVAEAFTPTAKHLHVIDCEFKAAGANLNFLSLADTNTTNNTADGLTFIRCKWVEADLATLAMVSVDGDLDGLTVLDCYLNLGVNTNDLPAIAIVATGKDVTNVYIGRNKIVRLNDANPLLIPADTTTANTGVVFQNFIQHLDTSGEALVSSSNIGAFENYGTAVVNTSGYIIPTADS